MPYSKNIFVVLETHFANSNFTNSMQFDDGINENHREARPIYKVSLSFFYLGFYIQLVAKYYP